MGWVQIPKARCEKASCVLTNRSQNRTRGARSDFHSKMYACLLTWCPEIGGARVSPGLHPPFNSLLLDGSLNAFSGPLQLNTAPKQGSCAVMLAGGCFGKAEELCCTCVLQELLERSLKQDDGSSRNTCFCSHPLPVLSAPWSPLPYTRSRKRQLEVCRKLWRPALPRALFPRGKVKR